MNQAVKEMTSILDKSQKQIYDHEFRRTGSDKVASVAVNPVLNESLRIADEIEQFRKSIKIEEPSQLVDAAHVIHNAKK